MQYMPLKLAGIQPLQFNNYDGTTQMLHMHPNRVRPDGEQTAQNKRIVANLLQYFENCAGASPSFDDGHLLSMHRMSPDWCDYLTLFHRELSLAKSQIIFFNLSTGELPAQTFMGKIVLCHNHASASLFIATMDHPWA